jgi:Ca2+-binding RTX toxin-like protein
MLMQRRLRAFFLIACIGALGLQGVPASADHNIDDHSDNITQLSRVAPTNTATNSDLAFFQTGASDYAVAGNYAGFRIIDITNPVSPTVTADFACNGPQNDVSVIEGQNATGGFRRLLFQSIDSPQSAEACNSTTVPQSATAFEGIRIFDITDPAAPVFLDGVPTDCGSHTHTLVPQAANNRVYVYVSSYPLSNLTEGFTKDDGTACLEPHNKISIVRVSIAAPETADDRDPVTGAYANVIEDSLDGFTKETEITSGGRTLRFKGCHDIGIAVDLNLAAGACFEEGQLWDISNPENPAFRNRWRNDNNTTIDLYHSAGFTWDGKMVIFGDEAGGGGDSRCRYTKDQQGRFWFHELDSLRPVGSFKIPRPQTGNCTGHIYNAIPTTNGKYILASSWYDGGTSVIDFTNPTAAEEIAYYDAQEDPATMAIERANVWATYWFNGIFVANDIGRGVEIYSVDHPAVQAYTEFPGVFNPQTQEGLFVEGGCDVFGTAGHDILNGTSGDDVICGFGGHDEIRGMGGHDTLQGGDGNDFLVGGPGRDVIRGGAGHDAGYGGGGADRMFGGAGHDSLSGRRGNDYLRGNSGDDYLDGGPGTDRCNGGPGSDIRVRCE